MSSFPTTIDDLGTAVKGNVIHASHINDLRSAVENIEGKIGIDNSNDSSSIDYSLRYAGLMGEISTDPLLTASYTSGTITAANGAVYTFSSQVSRLFINVHPDIADYVYVRLNSSVCNITASEWDFCITGGAQLKYEDEKNLISRVCLYCSVDPVMGTGIVVKGIV